MGIIKRVLHHSNPLRLSRFTSFFLDMEENIHIHYRDLRIELSRGEFEDFVHTFRAQSDELLKIIRDTNYRDGRLPNANKQDVRIWTESRLKHSVSYHPTRLSIEECTDGYHLHYRNYKILLDELEFSRLREAFAKLDSPVNHVATYGQIVELLDANHIDYLIDQGNTPPQTLAIAVAHYHQGKVDTILKSYGFQSALEDKQLVYSSEHLTVRLKVYGANTSIAFAPGKAHRDTLLLTEYLTFHQVNNDVNLVNALKCEVLNLYWQITNSAHPVSVDIDPNTWLFSRTSRHIIFPYKPLQTALPTVAQQGNLLLKNWSALQARYAITAAKPNKRLFDNELQTSFTENIRATLLERVASSPAVARIYLMGSASRGEMGLYCAPYAYGKLAKVGSDIDILIEIEPDREQDIPLNWKLVSRRAQNSSCAVYHIGEIPSPWPVVHFEESYPNIALTHHVIDAHVYLPSTGDADLKQHFLTDHKAMVLYDKARDGPFQSETVRHLISDLERVAGITPEHLSEMPVHTQNKLYAFSASQQDYVLKLHQVAGNFGWDRIAEHTLYEFDLLTALKTRGLSVPAILSTRGAIVDGLPAIVFEKISGSIFNQPPFPLSDIAKTLATFHQAQLGNPLAIPSTFLFEQVWKIWTKSFYKHLKHSSLSATLANQQEKLSVFADRLIANKPEQGLFVTSPNLHVHGDVTPRNFIQGAGIFIFDFNNAYFGPRIVDVLDGAFEFSLSSQQLRIDDFDSFIERYREFAALDSSEQNFITDWILVVGIIKFAKEIKMIVENNNKSSRENRALQIADCIFSKVKLS